MSNSRASFIRVSYGNLTVAFNLIENGSLSNNRTSNQRASTVVIRNSVIKLSRFFNKAHLRFEYGYDEME